jgi:hypothetical protein
MLQKSCKSSIFYGQVRFRFIQSKFQTEIIEIFFFVYYITNISAKFLLTQHNDTQHNDTQHNDIQHNDTQLKGPICDTQHK